MECELQFNVRIVKESKACQVETNEKLWKILSSGFNLTFPDLHSFHIELSRTNMSNERKRNEMCWETGGDGLVSTPRMLFVIWLCLRRMTMMNVINIQLRNGLHDDGNWIFFHYFTVNQHFTRFKFILLCSGWWTEGQRKKIYSMNARERQIESINPQNKQRQWNSWMECSAM